MLPSVRCALPWNDDVVGANNPWLLHKPLHNAPSRSNSEMENGLSQQREGYCEERFEEGSSRENE